MNIIARNVKLGLYILGCWPGITSTPIYFVMVGSFIFSLIFQLWNAVAVATKLDSLMNNLSTSMAVTSIVLKLLVFRFKYGSSKEIINEMFEDLKTLDGVEERKLMMKNVGLSINLTKVVTFCYNALLLSYVRITVMSYKAESIDDRQLIMQANFPINAKKSPIFEILCVFQFLVAFFATNCHAVLEGLLMVSVLHANTKAFAVCQEITKFSKVCQADYSREIVYKAKRRLIEKHLRYINFSLWIQDTFSYISFFHLFLLTLINCIVGYMLISFTSVNQDNISTMLLCTTYILTALAATASYCIAGEYLTYQGNQIYEVLYNCPWYTFKTIDSKILIFMIMKVREPITIRAGSFSELSLVYFTQILKTSVSYLSLVRAVTK